VLNRSVERSDFYYIKSYIASYLRRIILYIIYVHKRDELDIRVSIYYILYILCTFIICTTIHHNILPELRIIYYTLYRSDGRFKNLVGIAIWREQWQFSYNIIVNFIVPTYICCVFASKYYASGPHMDELKYNFNLYGIKDSCL